MCGVDDEAMAQCAACGRDGDDLKTCAACKSVKYCNAECQKQHRREHRRLCKKEAAPLFDEKLFVDPPPRDDCPICFLPMPCQYNELAYQSCCGKFICGGCYYSCYVTAEDGAGESYFLCPFCRAPPNAQPTKGVRGPNDIIVRLKKLIRLGDAEAFAQLGDIHFYGFYGVQQNMDEALRLWSEGADRGSAKARYNLGGSYRYGRGVDIDIMKAKYHFELAAIAGCDESRYCLGRVEVDLENVTRAILHWKIAAMRGHDKSLKILTELYRGTEYVISKNDLKTVLRAHKDSTDDMKSEQRDKFPEWRRDVVPGAMPIPRG